MRHGMLLLFCLTLFAQSAGPSFYVTGGFMKGNDYLELDAPERAAYAAGFINGMEVAAMVLNVGNSPREPKWLNDCTKGMSDRQIAEIMRKDIQDKPAEWHRGLNVLGLSAMVTACKPYVGESSVER